MLDLLSKEGGVVPSGVVGAVVVGLIGVVGMSISGWLCSKDQQHMSGMSPAVKS